ncbi:MAG TPA: hypothetical protein VEI58_01525, partial [Chthoniobacterales bacterium]|nr:hypothetical protein [Chthoniobacterales bacterium]
IEWHEKFGENATITISLPIFHWQVRKLANGMRPPNWRNPTGWCDARMRHRASQLQHLTVHLAMAI